jgi:hypothetical protein
MLTQRFRQLRALSEHVTEEQSVTAAASLHRWASPINDLPAGPDTGGRFFVGSRRTPADSSFAAR